jgi:two-component sensor histidine kinase
MAAHLPLLPDAANSLALAVVASSNSPVLLLDGEMKVVAASASFCRAFKIDPADAPGREIFVLGSGEWDAPRLRSLLKATLSGHAEIDEYEMDLKRAGEAPRHLVLNAQQLDYGDADNVRLLVAISDVTDARHDAKLKDDLLREKAILLQELQHRVANSLQIIASVLLGSARRVNSDETRSHLYDAHQRVMSVAAVQRQLAATRLGEVELRPYFTDLCHSIGASMIHDHAQISLLVNVDDGVAAADVSVSLGLIVTELVINALKHAFPGHRKGVIRVDYRSDGPAWTLAVADDGVGMPQDAASLTSGLGTSIIEALAKQLDARIEVADRDPGVAVSVIHAGEREL